MDYNHIQRSIIAGAVGEGRFQAVSYLEPSDFSPELKPVWKIVLECKGDLKEIYKRSKSEYFTIYLLSDYTHIEILGLLLLEHRFKTLLVLLLQDIALKSENASEGLILAQTINEIENHRSDVFELIDRTHEYLQPFISDESHKRLLNLQAWVNKRALQVKEVLG